MASLLISTLDSSQSRESWITSQEQILNLAMPTVKNWLATNWESHGRNLYPFAIRKIAVEFFKLSAEPPLGPSSLPSNLTNWYTALERIGALPDKIPPLPLNIREILESPCPIQSTDETPLTVGETHSLYLIPAGTLNELEQRVSSYGQKFFQGENPLKFKYFWDAAREEHAKFQFSEPQWVLISNDVLPDSRKEPYVKQAQMLEILRAKSLADYQVPTIREAIGAIFLHKVATEKSLYQTRNEQNSQCSTYTRVQETTQDWRLIVGGFGPSGLRVCDCYYDDESVGIAALRKF